MIALAPMRRPLRDTTSATIPLASRRPAPVARVRFGLLVAAPIAAAIAVLAVAAIAGEDQRWPIIDAMTRAAKVVALFGCLVGGLSFRRSDPRCRGWLLLAGNYALLVLRDAVLHRSLLFDIDAPGARWVELTMIALANLAGVLGTWTLTRAWITTGGGLVGAGTGARRVQIATAVMAAAVTVPSLVIHAPQLLAGSPFGMMGVIGAVGDTLAITVITPLLVIGPLVRGPRAAWPWGLLGASIFGWICYDATYSMSAVMNSGGEALRALGEAFRVVAAVAAGSAAIAQRLVATAPLLRPPP